MSDNNVVREYPKLSDMCSTFGIIATYSEVQWVEYGPCTYLTKIIYLHQGWLIRIKNLKMY